MPPNPRPTPTTLTAHLMAALAQLRLSGRLSEDQLSLVSSVLSPLSRRIFTGPDHLSRYCPTCGQPAEPPHSPPSTGKYL